MDFLKASLSDSRSVVPGDAPWSKLGEYGTNVKLQYAGKPFALINFGNNIKTNIKMGIHIPIADLFTIKSLGEKDGVWTIEVISEVGEGYFDSILKMNNYNIRFTMAPQVYSAVPLLMDWVAVDEALYDKASGHMAITRRNVNRRGHDSVPAGRVTDLSSLLFADVERPRFAKEGTEHHRITRRMTIKVRCRHA